jgi:cytoskeletal protein CcmA (bactofilin family)
MSIWKDNTALRPNPAPAPETREPVRADPPPPAQKPEFTHNPAPAPMVTPSQPIPRAETNGPRKESLIAADITIEGKIEGGGSVRIAGKFKGDVTVQGDLTIEAGAKLTGAVHADKVTVAGELEGSVEEATRIDLLATGVVLGNLKAGSLTVAAGARMRGQADFGWGEGKGPKARHNNESGTENLIRS